MHYVCALLSQSILDDGVLSTADRVSNTVIQFLEVSSNHACTPTCHVHVLHLSRDQDTDNNAVVLSGCGTSGRLAFVIAVSKTTPLVMSSSIPSCTTIWTENLQ